MYVIGTAGHVDHGKSTLVRALTGIDPDRLEEEKRRGLTIDLGFAWLALPSGREVGIVDVPGHERFIKNMLAGVGAINVNLFIVAANEGWKPQSQEHLDIIDLLGVSAAVVVLTKIDTVDRTEAADVTLTVKTKLLGTSLQDAPLIAVSALTGEGLDELVATIDRIVGATPPAQDIKRPRLWIDRAFTMKGSGTVVTGTLTGGSLQKGTEVEILPGGRKARIRSIQSHKKEVPRLGPGNRAALNLAGAEHHSLSRGEVLTLPGIWRPSNHILASIRLLEHLEHEVGEKGAYKLYIGSVELDASLRFLDKAPVPGEEAIASVRLERPTIFDFHDRFILRDSGRRQTLGGGLVLEAHPKRVHAGAAALVSGANARLTADRSAYLSVLLEEEGFLHVSEIGLRTGLTPDEIPAGAIRLPSFVVSATTMQDLREAALKQIESYQVAHPLDPGIPLTELRTAMRLDANLLNELIVEFARAGAVVADSTAVRTPEFSPETERPEKLELIDLLNQAAASPPSVPELRMKFGEDLVRALLRTGELVQVSAELVYTSTWLAELKGRVAEKVEESGPFTVAGFRDMVHTSRKYAVPLLEHLDAIGVTRRQGDLRTLGPNAV